MNHLTRQQVFALVDGTLDEAKRKSLSIHVNSCARCRKEVAFQQVITSVARTALQTTASVRFTDRVMSRVLRTAQESSFSYKILQHLGYVFAMMLVVGVLGYALINPAKFLGGHADAQPSELVARWRTFSASTNQFFQHSAEQFNQAITQKSTTPSSKIILMTLCILGVYGVLDRFVFQKVVRMKM